MGNPQERPFRLTPQSVAGLMVGEGYFGISVRNDRRTSRFKIQMLPSASFGMNDVEAVAQVSAFLTECGIAHVYWKNKKKKHATLNIHGLKRLNIFLPWILPHLFGEKKLCAENLYEYVQYRLSQPHQAMLTDRDLDFVQRARSLNGAQGASRTVDLDKLRGILRDYTSSLEHTKRFVQVKR